MRAAATSRGESTVLQRIDFPRDLRDPRDSFRAALVESERPQRLLHALAQEPDSSASTTAAGSPALALFEGEDGASATKERKRSWLLWTGSATFLGLFAAAMAHDLSHESPNKPVPHLPFFPNTP